MSAPWPQHPDRPVPPPGSPGPRGDARAALVNRLERYASRWTRGALPAAGLRILCSRWGIGIVWWTRDEIKGSARPWRLRHSDGRPTRRTGTTAYHGPVR